MSPTRAMSPAAALRTAHCTSRSPSRPGTSPSARPSCTLSAQLATMTAPSAKPCRLDRYPPPGARMLNRPPTPTPTLAFVCAWLWILRERQRCACACRLHHVRRRRPRVCRWHHHHPASCSVTIGLPNGNGCIGGFGRTCTQLSGPTTSLLSSIGACKCNGPSSATRTVGASHRSHARPPMAAPGPSVRPRS